MVWPRRISINPHAGTELSTAEPQNLHPAKSAELQNLHPAKSAELQNLHPAKSAELQNLHPAKSAELQNLHPAKSAELQNLHPAKSACKICTPLRCPRDPHDYTGISQTITIPQGADSHTVTIPLINGTIA